MTLLLATSTLERYNKALLTTEDGTIRLLNTVLDRSFNRLIRRLRVHLRLGLLDPAQRNVLLLQELRQLVPAVRPDKVDAYDRLLRNLSLEASRTGVVAASSITEELLPTRPRVDVSIPLEATVAAASQAKGYLLRHGEDFAQTSALVVAQGIAEGRPTDSMVQDMRARLSVVKSRANTIVRTESIRAYSTAADHYYAENNIDLVIFYATSDDRSCPICVSRAGRIYRRVDLKLPLHPRCRCTKAPYDPDIAAIDPDYASLAMKHRNEVAKHSGISLSEDLTRSVFESQAPIPVI